MAGSAPRPSDFGPAGDQIKSKVRQGQKEGDVGRGGTGAAAKEGGDGRSGEIEAGEASQTAARPALSAVQPGLRNHCCGLGRAVLFEMSERQRRTGFERLDSDVAADFSHDWVVQQLSDQKLLIVLEIRNDDLQEIVRLA